MPRVKIATARNS